MSNIDPTCSRRRPTLGRAEEQTWIVGAGILSTLSICSKVRRKITVRSKVNDFAQYVVTIHVIVMQKTRQTGHTVFYLCVDTLYRNVYTFLHTFKIHNISKKIPDRDATISILFPSCCQLTNIHFQRSTINSQKFCFRALDSGCINY